MSFGNFASKLHRDLAGLALNKTTVLCRDIISFDTLQTIDRGRGLIEFIFVPDLALSYRVMKMPAELKKKKSRYIVLTARSWMDIKRQTQYEKVLVTFVKYLWEKYRLKTYFVPMAINPNEDNDNEVAERLSKYINNDSIFYIHKVKRPSEVQKLLKGARFSVCTRMHSAILSFTAGTPFITIGYEYKTKGLMDFLNLKRWHIEIEDVSVKALSLKADMILRKKHFTEFTNTIRVGQRRLSIYRKILDMNVNQLILNK